MVWARRFAGYKRADLLLQDKERFRKLLENKKYPVQIIFAGKPYPVDFAAISTFNNLVEESKNHKNMAVLTGYELSLSKSLKQGSDVWLNNPRVPREASGTSGMTASMNASVNLSTDDGSLQQLYESVQSRCETGIGQYRMDGGAWRRNQEALHGRGQNTLLVVQLQPGSQHLLRSQQVSG
jgi:glucan phosphorylase